MAIEWYQLCWYFAIYSFLGWVAEVIFHAVTFGEVVNRGFLNGPVCPIYGFGMVTILYLAESFLPGGSRECSLLILVPVGILFATVIELFAGWILEKLFHARWWDYRERPFNLKGYICLEFSLIWGVAVVLAVRVLHPIVDGFIMMMVPDRYGWLLIGVIAVIYLTDTALTVAMVIGITRELKALESLSTGIRTVSDTLSEVVGESTLKGTVKVQENMVQAALAKAELRDAASSAKSEILDAASSAKTAISAKVQSTADMMQNTKDEIAGKVISAKDGIADRMVSAKDGIADRVVSAKDGIADRMVSTKDGISDKMHQSGEELSERIRDLQNDLSEKSQNYNRRFRRFRRRMKFRLLGTGRMFAAYPKLQFYRYEETVKRLASAKDEELPDPEGSGEGIRKEA
ncbi:MAG: hypothetical protein J5825_07165 [Lachnospiraceae bacterium]|nr:hypothetical protein [Lachnospiraceae bacterium]